MLPDVENLFVNSRNHGTNPWAFLEELPEGVVTEVHAAGGPFVRRLGIDAWDEPSAIDLVSRIVSDFDAIDIPFGIAGGVCGRTIRLGGRGRDPA